MANKGPDMVQYSGSTYTYSARSTQSLSENEYTLVTIAVESSNSTRDIKEKIEHWISSIASIDEKRDRILLRVVTFNSRVEEVHGFKLLSDTSANEYVDCIAVSGSSVLVDALVNSYFATTDFAKRINPDEDISVNGLVIALSDGSDFGSTFGIQHLRQAYKQVVGTSFLDSFASILNSIAVTDNLVSDTVLPQVQAEGCVTLYVDTPGHDDSSFQQSFEFVKKVILDTSKSLGSRKQSMIIRKYNSERGNH